MLNQYYTNISFFGIPTTEVLAMRDNLLDQMEERLDTITGNTTPPAGSRGSNGGIVIKRDANGNIIGGDQNNYNY
jgi:hypothetical protein